jgi:hypothetical protein
LQSSALDGRISRVMLWFQAAACIFTPASPDILSDGPPSANTQHVQHYSTDDLTVGLHQHQPRAAWGAELLNPTMLSCCASPAGRAKGAVAVTPKGTIQLQYNWGAPHGGTGVDEFSIDKQGRLRLCTLATVADDSVQYCQVYNRKR